MAKKYWFRMKSGQVLHGLSIDAVQSLADAEDKDAANQSTMEGVAAATNELQDMAKKASAPQTPPKIDFPAQDMPSGPEKTQAMGSAIENTISRATAPQMPPPRIAAASKKYAIDLQMKNPKSDLAAPMAKELGQYGETLQKDTENAQIENDVRTGVQQFTDRFSNDPNASADEMSSALSNLIVNTRAQNNHPAIGQLQKMVDERRQIEVKKKAMGSATIEPNSVDAKIAEWAVDNNQPVSTVMKAYSGMGKNLDRKAVLGYMIEYARSKGGEYTDTEASAGAQALSAGARKRAQIAPDILAAEISKQIRGQTGKTLGVQSMAAERAIKTMEESRDPKTGDYKDINNPIYTDLMADYAKVLFPSSQIGIEVIKEVKQGSLRGSVVDAWNKLSGSTETVPPKKVLDMMLGRFRMLKGVIDMQLSEQIEGTGETTPEERRKTVPAPAPGKKPAAPAEKPTAAKETKIVNGVTYEKWDDGKWHKVK